MNLKQEQHGGIESMSVTQVCTAKNTPLFSSDRRSVFEVLHYVKQISIMDVHYSRCLILVGSMVRTFHRSIAVALGALICLNRLHIRLSWCSANAGA